MSDTVSIVGDDGIALPEDIRRSLAWGLLSSMAELERILHSAEASFPLGPADRRLVSLLSDGVGRTMRDITERLGVAQSTVNRQVNSAVVSGLIEPDKSQVGSRTYRLTRRGMALLRDDFTLRSAHITAAIGAIPPDRRSEFVEHVKLYVESYGRSVDPPPP